MRRYGLVWSLGALATVTAVLPAPAAPAHAQTGVCDGIVGEVVCYARDYALCLPSDPQACAEGFLCDQTPGCRDHRSPPRHVSLFAEPCGHTGLSTLCQRGFRKAVECIGWLAPERCL